MARGPGKAHKLTPFYVALREAERRMLRAAYIDLGSTRAAALALGITRAYFVQRAVHLGGVFENQPEREPPGTLADARVNARSEGVRLKEATWALRRFGKPLKKRTRKHVIPSDGHDPAQRISGDPGSEEESGGGTSSAPEPDQGDEDRSE